MLALLNQVISKILLTLIYGYRYLISPILPARCRFYPTCSSYGLQAILWHGWFRGGILTIKRIVRCQPWGGSGVDFVPLPLYRYRYQLLSQLPIGWAVKRHRQPY